MKFLFIQQKLISIHLGMRSKTSLSLGTHIRFLEKRNATENHIFNLLNSQRDQIFTEHVANSLWRQYILFFNKMFWREAIFFSFSVILTIFFDLATHTQRPLVTKSLRGKRKEAFNFTHSFQTPIYLKRLEKLLKTAIMLINSPIVWWTVSLVQWTAWAKVQKHTTQSIMMKLTFYALFHLTHSRQMPYFGLNP